MKCYCISGENFEKIIEKIEIIYRKLLKSMRNFYKIKVNSYNYFVSYKKILL